MCNVMESWISILEFLPKERRVTFRNVASRVLARLEKFKKFVQDTISKLKIIMKRHVPSSVRRSNRPPVFVSVIVEIFFRNFKKKFKFKDFAKLRCMYEYDHFKLKIIMMKKRNAPSSVVCVIVEIFFSNFQKKK